MVGTIRRVAFQAALSERTLPDVGDVYRLRAVGEGVDERPKGRARFPDDYAINLSDEPISITPFRPRPSEIVQGGQVRAVEDNWIIRFKSGRDIDSKDVVKATSLNNRVFNIIGLINASDEVIRAARASEIV